MPKRRFIILPLTFLLFLWAQLAGYACWNESFAQSDNLIPFDSLTPIEPDPENGERLFKKCKQCHTTRLGEKKIGPSLAGIIGRRPGSIEGFGYSQDMINFGAAGNLWNRETLDQFLTRPRDLLGRTKMAFPGFKKESDRADLIAYLSQF